MLQGSVQQLPATHGEQPVVRLNCGRELWRDQAQQHSVRAGAGWQAHLGELERGPAQCTRSGPCPRADVPVSQPHRNAAATSPTCGTCPARTPWPIPARIETIQRAHRGRCIVAGLQLGLERTDERRVPQRGSETKREFFSDLAHLCLDPTMKADA